MVASNRLQRWAREKGKEREEPESIRYEAYMALLDHRIRRAWVSPLFCTVFDIYAYSVLPIKVATDARTEKLT